MIKLGSLFDPKRGFWGSKSDKILILTPELNSASKTTQEYTPLFSPTAPLQYRCSLATNRHVLYREDCPACPVCCCIMKEVSGKRLRLCSKRAQHPSSKVAKESMLQGTIFVGARASPELILRICYCFSLKLTYSTTTEQTGASSQTIYVWHFQGDLHGETQVSYIYIS